MFFFFLFNVAFTHKVIYMFSDLVFCLLLVVYMKLCVLLKHDFHLLPAMASRLVAFYSNLVKRRPFVTQVLTAGIITTAGDILAQKIITPSKKYDYKRTLVMSTYGFCFLGPMVTTWLAIAKRLNMRLVYTLICDQLIAVPIVLGTFVFAHPIISGKSVEEAQKIFKAHFTSVILRAWLLWCPAQAINHAFVPYEFRLLYMQCVSLIWNSYLSYRSSRSLAKAGVEVKD